MFPTLTKQKERQMSESFLTASFILMSGGFQDAYTYWCRDRIFANAQTGNIVLMSSYLFEAEWSMVVSYLIPVISFMLGIFISEIVRLHYRDLEKIHWRQIVILIEILLLFCVGFIPESFNPLANAVVSFVCAMQVQAFKTIHGYAYASTMCIGNLRSGTEALCLFLHDHNKATLIKSLTYLRVIGFFAVGAGAGSFMTIHFGLRSIWVCCALLLISFAVMFIPKKTKQTTLNVDEMKRSVSDILGNAEQRKITQISNQKIKD